MKRLKVAEMAACASSGAVLGSAGAAFGCAAARPTRPECSSTATRIALTTAESSSSADCSTPHRSRCWAMSRASVLSRTARAPAAPATPAKPSQLSAGRTYSSCERALTCDDSAARPCWLNFTQRLRPSSSEVSMRSEEGVGSRPTGESMLSSCADGAVSGRNA